MSFSLFLLHVACGDSAGSGGGGGGEESPCPPVLGDKATLMCPLECSSISEGQINRYCSVSCDEGEPPCPKGTACWISDLGTRACLPPCDAEPCPTGMFCRDAFCVPD